MPQWLGYGSRGSALAPAGSDSTGATVPSCCGLWSGPGWDVGATFTAGQPARLPGVFLSRLSSFADNLSWEITYGAQSIVFDTGKGLIFTVHRCLSIPSTYGIEKLSVRARNLAKSARGRPEQAARRAGEQESWQRSGAYTCHPGRFQAHPAGPGPNTTPRNVMANPSAIGVRVTELAGPHATTRSFCPVYNQ